MSQLQRFKSAQGSAFAGFDSALDEIRGGRKRGHWIWYVFPQVAGLGSSPTAQTFAITSTEEAKAYLRDPDLRSRLLSITSAVAEQLRSRKVSLRQLMGSEIDALKIVSSLTLFGRVAGELQQVEGLAACGALSAAAHEVLTLAAEEGYPPCAYTLRFLGRPE
jgi:uncharacterized protein (DUF1810 family)